MVMNFKEAYQKMLEGKKVKRKGRSSYCFYDSEAGRICTGDGLVITGIDFEAALADDWEVVEEKKKKKYWEPKYNETYYEMYNSGIYSDTNLDTNADKFRFSIGNYFKTKEEAEHMIEKLKVIHELQKFAYENNEKEIDWNDENQEKHVILYSNNRKELDITCVNSSKYLPFNIYFTSLKIAKRAIAEIGADRIKKYYFNVED